MAVYRGPRAKVERRLGEAVFGQAKALRKKAYPPGQHGRMRRKKSEYALQLLEKQKAKYMYGLLEKQFANLFDRAVRKRGITGETLLQLLETRLDNVVYRLGLAPTRRSARQLVLHKHILVNDTVVHIPSFTVCPGDLIGVRTRSQGLLAIQSSLSAGRARLSWLEWDASKMTGKLVEIPSREDIPENISEKSIVELYSK